MLLIYNGNSLKSGIYEIRNRITNISYIGSAGKFKTRWNSHIYSFMNNKQRNRYMQNSFNKYFKALDHSNFIEFHILEIMENSIKSERLIREEYWITCALENNVNLYNFNLKPTKENKNWSNNPEETSKKHQAIKGKKYEEIVGVEKAKIWKSRQGKAIKKFYDSIEGLKVIKKHIARVKNKTYEEIYGSKKAEEIKFKIGEPRREKSYEEFFGSEKAEEMRKKQSQSHKKRFEDNPELAEIIRQKMMGENNHFYGKKHTEKTKQRISDLQKGKTLEERCGKEKAIILKQKRREAKLKELEKYPERKEILGNSIRGKTLEEIYGVEKAKEIKSKRSNRIAKTYNGFCLIDTCGNIYTEIINMSQFCRIHELDSAHLVNLIKGKLKTHKGWKLIVND